MFWSNWKRNRDRHQKLSAASSGVALLESLEERRLMAVDPMSAASSTGSVLVDSTTVGSAFSVTVNSGKLSIIGSSYADTVTVSLSAVQPISGSTKNVDVTISNGVTSSNVSKTGVTSIFFDGKSSGDKITNLTTSLPMLARGGTGNDTLNGGGASDTLIGGYGDDVLNGYGGDDTLVDIGGGQKDQFSGGTGTDYFWADSESTETVSASSSETSDGNVHRISAFEEYQYIWYSGTTVTYSSTRDPDGADLPDPRTGYSYVNFSANPLFGSSGPVKDDINQGNVGDCWIMSALSAVADTAPAAIRRTVADLGDGTFAVHFVDGSSEVYFRVDADLPTYSWGSPSYAKLGTDNSLWVAIVEKAWAFFRYRDGNYDSLSMGNTNAVYNAMGSTAIGLDINSTYTSKNTASDFIRYIKGQLDAGLVVTVLTLDSGSLSPLVNNHWYQVDYIDSTGQIHLRNPYGGSSAYITISASDLLASCDYVSSAYFE